jgi:CRISPR-associated endonuclease Cas2
LLKQFKLKIFPKKMRRSHQKNRKNKISLKDFILLLSAKLIDVYFEIRDPFNLISSYYHYFNKPFSSIEIKKLTQKYSKLCSELKQKKYLLKKSNPKKCQFFLTKKTEKYLKTKYPHLYFNKQNWDKKLRLVIFDVQEINRFKRNQLRRLLKQLGFIMLQKSVWLSPYDQFETIKRWIKENKLQEKILLIETEKIAFKNKDKFISQFW